MMDLSSKEMIVHFSVHQEKAVFNVRFAKIPCTRKSSSQYMSFKKYSSGFGSQWQEPGHILVDLTSTSFWLSPTVLDSILHKPF